MSWSSFPEERPGGEWDSLVAGLEGASVYQSSAWAEHKRASGWRPVRACERGPGGSVRAAVQALRRDAGPASLLWARGGPMGEPSLWDEGLRAELSRGAGPLAYLRVSPYREDSGPLRDSLLGLGWSRPPRPLDRGASFVLDLRGSEAQLEKGLSRNWAHNLRRGLKRCAPARAWGEPDPASVLRLYRRMEEFKDIAALLGERDFFSLLSSRGELVFFRVDAPDGSALALRACALFGGSAWDLLAATSPEGRRCYASYAAFWSLALAVRSRGALSYELGGADPERARGVHDFKKGTGARPVQYAGEWDWSRPAFLRPLAGHVASWKA